MQTDVARIGGITPWLKVAHAAEAFDVPMCPHFLMELHVSLACAVPNGRYVEYIPQLDELTTEGMKVEDGMAVAPARRASASPGTWRRSDTQRPGVQPTTRRKRRLACSAWAW